MHDHGQRTVQLDCDYESCGGVYICIRCGDARPMKCRRNCTGTPTSRDWEFIRRSREVREVIESHCLPCDRYPCLGTTQCGHEQAVRMGEHCPLSRW